MSMQKLVLDARALEHPKPLEEAVRLLQQMDETAYLHMIHRKNPIPLLQMAKERGYRTLSIEKPQGTWHIFITKNPQIDLKEKARHV